MMFFFLVPFSSAVGSRDLVANSVSSLVTKGVSSMVTYPAPITPIVGLVAGIASKTTYAISSGKSLPMALAQTVVIEASATACATVASTAASTTGPVGMGFAGYVGSTTCRKLARGAINTVSPVVEEMSHDFLRGKIAHFKATIRSGKESLRESLRCLHTKYKDHEASAEAKRAAVQSATADSAEAVRLRKLAKGGFELLGEDDQGHAWWLNNMIKTNLNDRRMDLQDKMKDGLAALKEMTLKRLLLLKKIERRKG